MKYTSTDYAILAGNKIIAQLYVGGDLIGNNELRIKQGMPRQEVVSKIIADCPEFSNKYGLTADYYPRLF